MAAPSFRIFNSLHFIHWAPWPSPCEVADWTLTWSRFGWRKIMMNACDDSGGDDDDDDGGGGGDGGDEDEDEEEEEEEEEEDVHPNSRSLAECQM